MGILKVYWRPGCSFCANLSRHLKKADIKAEYINIWEDTEALQFVRQENDGDETVPTVVFQDQVSTNPDPIALIKYIQEKN